VKKPIVSDRSFFWIVVGVSLAVPVLVTILKYLPDAYRPNANFARFLPGLNALFNSGVTLCLLLGFWFIRVKKNKAAHQASMFTAFVLSALFLISYVVYHTTMPSTPYGGEGFMKGLSMYYSTTSNFVKHKKIARITWPLWLYVAITGVVVYLMISPYYTFAS